MSKYLKVTIAGNPNTGKSSLFNALTGLNQKTGNFPGITVEKLTGYLKLPSGQTVQLTDLPGTYSLFPKSADEAVPLEILSNPFHEHYPHLIIFVADASNLTRNLVLLTQLIDLRFPVILALNMKDQADLQGIDIDVEGLKKSLGIPVVCTNGRTKLGIKELIGEIQRGTDTSPCTFINPEKRYPIPLEKLKTDLHLCNAYQALLSLSRFQISPPKELSVKELITELKTDYKFDSGTWQREDLLYRYKQVAKLVALHVHVEEHSAFKKRQERMDRVMTHPFWGYILFFTILFLVFQAIFSWAELPMQWIENSIGWAQDKVHEILPAGILANLIADGILAGLSGVLVFIPQIAFLFFFIALMEDTGYLARVAFMMDRLMRRFGLNGKSVIPLISGTACAVPAIMAARNIENTKSRLITILVTPLMSCSARLPVFILLIGIIIPEGKSFGFLSNRGLVLMGMYILGFLAVIAAAWFFNLVLKFKEKSYFILELPVYRSPNWRTVWLTVYKRVRTFVTEAGKIIIAISIVLWFLSNFGPGSSLERIDEKYAEQQKMHLHPAAELEKLRKTERLEKSFAGRIGNAIEPAIAPLGYDWKIGIALVTSFAAREVFVGTMATLYGLEGEDSDLRSAMIRSRDRDTGNPVYTFATCVSLLIFYLFALQCMSTVAVTYKETASLKWTLIQFSFMAALAYFSSLIVYQLLR